MLSRFFSAAVGDGIRSETDFVSVSKWSAISAVSDFRSAAALSVVDFRSGTSNSSLPMKFSLRASFFLLAACTAESFFVEEGSRSLAVSASSCRCLDPPPSWRWSTWFWRSAVEITDVWTSRFFTITETGFFCSDVVVVAAVNGRHNQYTFGVVTLQKLLWHCNITTCTLCNKGRVDIELVGLKKYGETNRGSIVCV